MGVDYRKPCNALLRIGIVITEPTIDDKTGNSNGSKVVHVNNGSIGIELEGYNVTDLIKQVYDKIAELRNLWPKTISLENSLTDAEKIISSTVEKLS